MKTILEPLLNQAHSQGKTYSWESYLSLLDLVVREERTTGPNQSPDYAAYTKKNWERMQHINQSIQLKDELVSLLDTIVTSKKWFVLTEAWCGDAAQNIPAIAKMATSNSLIELHFLLRDENPEIMELFLTEGGKSIPKLFCLDSDYNFLYSWGPRPQGAQELFLAHKANPVLSFTEFVSQINQWYESDKYASIQKEFAALLRK